MNVLGRSKALTWSAVHARRVLSKVVQVGLVGCAFALVGCGGSTPPPKDAAVSPGGSKDPSKWPKDDRSLCGFRGQPELEASETAGPGALKPNVRRVYKSFGEGETRHKSLVCREIDTNLDGIKDVVRKFNERGEATKEDADRNYDGRLDIWQTFVHGRLAEVKLDTNFDGKVDVWKAYNEGKLSRVKRDRNHDGTPDIWEIYVEGKLERMGVDVSRDGHVDRWDRDEELRLAQEAEERRELEKQNKEGPSAAPTVDDFDKGKSEGGSDESEGDKGKSEGGGDAKKKQP